jgi:hypothetical protein
MTISIPTPFYSDGVLVSGNTVVLRDMDCGDMALTSEGLSLIPSSDCLYTSDEIKNFTGVLVINDGEQHLAFVRGKLRYPNYTKALLPFIYTFRYEQGDCFTHSLEGVAVDEFALALDNYVRVLDNASDMDAFIKGIMNPGVEYDSLSIRRPRMQLDQMHDWNEILNFRAAVLPSTDPIVLHP